MDRKWRTNKSAIDTVLSFPDFVQHVGQWKNGYSMASLTDLYAVYTVLHIEDKQWAIKWSESAQIYYFIAKQTLDQGDEKKVSAPEGDEDVPEVGYFFIFLFFSPKNFLGKQLCCAADYRTGR